MKPIRFETLAWLFFTILLSSFLFWHFVDRIYLTTPALASYLSFYNPGPSFVLPFHEPINRLLVLFVSLCPLSFLHLWGVPILWFFFLFLWIVFFHYLFEKLRFVILSTFLLFFFAFLFHLTFDATFFSLLKAFVLLALLFFFFLSIETQREKYFALAFLVAILICGEALWLLLPYFFFLLFFSPIGRERFIRFWQTLYPYVIVVILFFSGFHWYFYFPTFSLVSFSWPYFFLYIFVVTLIAYQWFFLRELNLQMRVRTGAILSLLLFSFLFHIVFSANPFFVSFFITAVLVATLHLLFIIRQRRKRSFLWVPYLIILLWGSMYYLYDFQPYLGLQKANAYRYRALCETFFPLKEKSVLTDNLLFFYQCREKARLFRQPVTSVDEFYLALCRDKPTYLFVQAEFLAYLEQLWVSHEVVATLTLSLSQKKKLVLIRLDLGELSCPP